MVWPSTENIGSLQRDVIRDLKPFSVLKEVKLEEAKETNFRVYFETSKIKVRANFKLSPGNVVLVDADCLPQVVDYREFLASVHLADLDRIAELIPKNIDNPAEDLFVESCALVSEPEGEEGDSGKATEIISELLSRRLLDRSNVVFLRAPAGCGKTYILSKLTCDRARDYELPNGEGVSERRPLFLYIDAQGKALKDLDDIFARTADDIGGIINYQAIPVLTRNNLIIPIIDGFDELIGSGGHTEAFKSLSNFLASLEGSGNLLAAGRSSFYDSEVLRKISDLYKASDTYNYRITSVKLEPWDYDQIEEYFESYFGIVDDEEGLVIAIEYLCETNELNRELLSKPFYCSEVAKYIYENKELFDPEEEVLEGLVRSFVEREAQKIKNTQGEVILTTENHLELLGLWAEEMWWEEQRELDLETMKDYARLISEKYRVRTEDEQVLLGKLSSYALIKPVKNGFEDKYGFEHDEYYEYFLALVLTDYLRNKKISELVTFFNRSLITDSFLERFYFIADDIPVAEKTDWIIKIVEAAQFGRIPSNITRNSGVLAVTLLDRSVNLPSGLVLKNLEVPTGRVNDSVIENLKVINCKIDELDIMNSTIGNSEFSDTYIRVLKMNENTVLRGTRIIPGRNVEALLDNRTRDYIRNPFAMARKLKEVGADVDSYLREISQRPIVTDAQEKLIDLLFKFLRQADRSYFFSIDQDQGFSNIRTDRYWPVVEGFLRESGTLTDKKRRGVSYALQHLEFPAELIKAGQSQERLELPDPVIRFWDKLYNSN